MDTVNHLPNNRAHASVSHHRAKSRQFAMLSVQAIRRFPTLEQASLYLSHRVKSRQRERFAIQQTASNSWAVCRVMKGGL